MEIGRITISVSVILNTATGSRSIGHNAAIAVVLIVLVRGMPRPAERQAAEGGDVHVRTGDDGGRRRACMIAQDEHAGEISGGSSFLSVGDSSFWRRS